MPSNILPEGFKDDVTLQVSSEHKFKNMIIRHFELNGFKLVKTPLIEYTDKDTDNNIFKIAVNKSEKKLNIRDDITLQIARLSQTRLPRSKRPLKLCYYGEVVRKKGTMLRPERQFLQIGAECIGENNYLADVEMMELAYESLVLVGIKNITIEVSSRIFFDKFISSSKKNKELNEVKRLIKLKDLKGLLKIIGKKNHEYIKDIFACTGLYNDKKSNLNKLGIDKLTKIEISNIKDIITKFYDKNKKVNFFLDLCEVDDKNYHSGLRFTFFANNVRGEIAKGGRYFVNNSKYEDVATGFTCYMDSILRATSAKNTDKRILVPFDISKIDKKKLIEKNYFLIRNIQNIKINKKLAKVYDCQFYLDNKDIKVL